MDSSDWSNGIRYQTFVTRPGTELKGHPACHVIICILRSRFASGASTSDAANPRSIRPLLKGEGGGAGAGSAGEGGAAAARPGHYPGRPPVCLRGRGVIENKHSTDIESPPPPPPPRVCIGGDVENRHSIGAILTTWSCASV